MHWVSGNIKAFKSMFGMRVACYFTHMLNYMLATYEVFMVK